MLQAVYKADVLNLSTATQSHVWWIQYKALYMYHTSKQNTYTCSSVTSLAYRLIPYNIAMNLTVFYLVYSQLQY